MKQIIDIEELKKLPAGAKIFTVYKGDIRGFKIVGPNPWVNDSVVVVSSSNYASADTISKSDFREAMKPYGKKIFLDYDSKIVGATMVEQLENEITSIKETYLKILPATKAPSEETRLGEDQNEHKY